jgi:hypothetical protein
MLAMRAASRLRRASFNSSDFEIKGSRYVDDHYCPSSKLEFECRDLSEFGYQLAHQLRLSSAL